MKKVATPQAIVEQMLLNDEYSRWLGLSVLEIGAGFCTCEMTVRPEMVNGFGIAHGGISFGFADSAFAFASNSRGRHAVSIETSINHLAAVQVGDVLRAEATENHLSHRLGHYQVRVLRGDDELVALFKGVVYRKGQAWEME